jgi:hypothetical protein
VRSAPFHNRGVMAHRSRTLQVTLAAFWLPLGVVALVAVALDQGTAIALLALVFGVVWAAIARHGGRRVREAPTAGTVLAPAAQTRRAVLRMSALLAALLLVLVVATLQLDREFWVAAIPFVVVGQGLLAASTAWADARWERAHPGQLLVGELGVGRRPVPARWRSEWGVRAP